MLLRCRAAAVVLRRRAGQSPQRSWRRHRPRGHRQRGRHLCTAAAVVSDGVVPRPRTTGDLVDFLEVEPVSAGTTTGFGAAAVESDLYTGKATNPGWGRLFGGQLLGQALAAAQRSTGDALAASLQCYFIRPGMTDAPITYHVDHLRDGRSISFRSVRAVQHRKVIFSMMAAFDRSPPPPTATAPATGSPQLSLQHAEPMPSTPDPDSLMNRGQFFDSLDDESIPAFIRHLQKQDNPVEMRPSRHFHPRTPEAAPPDKHIMVRLKQPLPSAVAAGPDVALHQQRILAYVSDYGLSSTSLQPHKAVVFDPAVQTASLDHAMHFHRRFDDMDLAAEWLLHTTHSPVAHGGRGFTTGVFYRRSTADLVATTSQEGIARFRGPEEAAAAVEAAAAEKTRR